MTTLDFIIDLFCNVDDRMNEEEISKHPQASLYPSEIVTLGLLHAIKGVGNRPFYRWIVKDYLSLFPKLPERTRLFRLFKEHYKGIKDNRGLKDNRGQALYELPFSACVWAAFRQSVS